MSETLTLVVPMPPNIANGSHGHWRARHREKKEYWDALDVYASVLAAGHPRYVIPPPPPQPFPKATIRSVMYLGAAMDDSNAMRRHKWVEDWLTTRGYIVDDRKKCLKWAGFPEQIIKRDGNYRLVLTLTLQES
jgi:hypothetical protein